MERTYVKNTDLHRATITTNGNIYVVEGYACHFNVPNLNGEIVTPEVFEPFFRILEANHVMPYFNYDHGGTLIGGWDDIVADEVGLKVRGHIYRDIAFVKENLSPLIEGGELAHLSTEGFICEAFPAEDGYNVGEFELIGISLVPMPADMRAKVTITEPNKNQKTKSNFNKIILL